MREPKGTDSLVAEFPVRSSLGRVLITGASGFVGRALVQEFLADNVRVRASTSMSRLDNVSTGVEFIERLELENIAQWDNALHDVDAIIHCAARVHVLREKNNDPLRAFRRINVETTLALAQKAAHSGVQRFIFLSSIGIYGAETFGTAFGCSSPASPYSPYTQSKYEAECGLLQIAKNTGLEVVIIRPPLIYGPNAPGNFAKLLHYVDFGLPLPFANTKNRRSFVSRKNLVDFIKVALIHPRACEIPLIVSDSETISTDVLIATIASAMGKKPKLFKMPRRLLKGGLELLGKTSLAQQLLGSLEVDGSEGYKILNWTPPFNFYTSINDAVSYYRNRG